MAQACPDRLDPFDMVSGVDHARLPFLVAPPGLDVAGWILRTRREVVESERVQSETRGQTWTLGVNQLPVSMRPG